ncbi:MAG: DNA-directed RNA polymerase [Flavobacterium sp.]
MQLFRPIDYIKIAIANHYGLDKKLWHQRLDWFNTIGINALNELSVAAKFFSEASEPMMFMKMLNQYNNAMNNLPLDGLVSLDATASGVQILGALTACRKTCQRTNLIDDGIRHDLYGESAEYMNSLGLSVTRDDLKQPVMTVFYGSTEQPKLLFGEGTPELKAFYAFLENELTGAYEAMSDIANCWNPEALVHSWVLPDGHHVHVKVMEQVQKRIEVKELGSTFTYTYYENQASDYGRSLAANVVHSVDGYIVREVIRKAAARGFRVLTIHDSFWCHPNYANEMRQFYNDVMAEICEMDLLSDILSQITGEELEVIALSDRKELANDIRNANYALS